MNPTIPRPLQQSLVKKAASLLENWTGLTHSESLELTARAYGATSWAALRNQTEFVPDESLRTAPYNLTEALEARYARLAALLQTRLSIRVEQARLIAETWQPTALRAVFRLGKRHPPQSVDAVELVTLWGHRDPLPPGATLALASVPPSPAGVSPMRSLALVAVRPGRLARYVSRDDFVGMAGIVSDALPITWEFSTSKIAGNQAFMTDIAQPREPAGLQASWLRGPRMPADQLCAAFAAHSPWEAQDYPGVRKTYPSEFWACQLPGFLLKASIIGGTVFLTLKDTSRTHWGEWQVQIGAGGLSRFDPAKYREPSTPAGYYLVKYRTQCRGTTTLTGMTPELAAQVRELTGLGGADSDDAQAFWEEGGRAFFSSEAGLAFAKWCARFPHRMKEQLKAGSQENYLGPWHDQALARMEFELARKSALD